MQNWAQQKMQELTEKGRQNWTVEDCEAWAYCEECEAEQERDDDYMDNWDIW